MLAPIVTKDMRLFPIQKLPQIKNVRSRAQSLEHFQQLQNSSNTIDRLVPIKARNSQSTGNISRTPKGAKSPPKLNANRKSTLSAIQEGVEVTDHRIPHSQSETCSVQGGRKVFSITKIESENPSASSEEEEQKNSPNPGPKKKRGVLKWITNTFLKSSRSEKSYETQSTTSN